MHPSLFSSCLALINQSLTTNPSHPLILTLLSLPTLLTLPNLSSSEVSELSCLVCHARRGCHPEWDPPKASDASVRYTRTHLCTRHLFPPRKTNFFPAMQITCSHKHRITPIHTAHLALLPAYDGMPESTTDDARSDPAATHTRQTRPST